MKEVHVRKRETNDGFSFEYRFEIAQQNGQRKFRTKAGFKTKTEAKKAGLKAQQDYENHGIVQINDDLSVADLMSAWLGQADIKETTSVKYETAIRNYINPYIGTFRASSVDYQLLQVKVLDELYNRGYSPTTISNVSSIITQAFTFGSNTLNIPKRFEKLKIPKSKPKDLPTRSNPHVFVTPEQVKSLFHRFPEGDAHHIPLVLGYSCGLRIGEVYALTWDDIDFDSRTISISKQVQWFQCGRAGSIGQGGIRKPNVCYGYWYFTGPKYGENRIVDILDMHIVNLLRREKDRQEKTKSNYSAIGPARDSSGNMINPYTQNYLKEYEGKLVIVTEKTDKPIQLVMVRDDGTYINSRTSARVAKVAKEELGIAGFDFHSLRHTHATMLCNRIDENSFDSNGKKISPVYVQKRLGHKSIQTTLDIYYHLTEEKRKNESIKIDGLYAGVFD